MSSSSDGLAESSCLPIRTRTGRLRERHAEPGDPVVHRNLAVPAGRDAVDLDAREHPTGVHVLLDERERHDDQERRDGDCRRPRRATRRGQVDDQRRRAPPASIRGDPRRAVVARASRCAGCDAGSNIWARLYPASVRSPRGELPAWATMGRCDPTCAASCSMPARRTTTSRARSREGWLPLLALDRLVAPGRPTHDVAEVAALAGTDEDRVRRLWRAVGFPDVPDGSPVFTDADVEAARLVLDGAFARRGRLRDRAAQRAGDQHRRWLASPRCWPRTTATRSVTCGGRRRRRDDRVVARRGLRGRRAAPRCSCTRPGSSCAPPCGAA